MGDHIMEQVTFFFKLDRDILLDSCHALNLDYVVKLHILHSLRLVTSGCLATGNDCDQEFDIQNVRDGLVPLLLYYACEVHSHVGHCVLCSLDTQSRHGLILPQYVRDPVTSDCMLVCFAFRRKFDPEQVLMEYILSRVALVITSKLNMVWLIKKI